MNSETGFYAEIEPDRERELEEWTARGGLNFAALRGVQEAKLPSISRHPAKTLENWSREVFRVCSRLHNPSQVGKRAQLVVGRVQAGKTSNFTGVIAAASDNGFNLFFVIAGSSKNLRDQTLSRLKGDLKVCGSPSFEIIPSDPSKEPILEAKRLIDSLGTLQNESPFGKAFARKLIYVILKEDDHLLWVNKVIASVNNSDFKSKNALTRANTLIIDDECDQASPNAGLSKNKVAAIYGAIGDLREAIPAHSYVGYTATPYANILMDVDDLLRPEVVTVLEPGEDYIGTSELFGGTTGVGLESFAKEILDWDLERDRIPESLVEAIADFMVQVAVLNSGDSEPDGLIEPPMRFKAGPTTATMLVHPHQHVKHASRVVVEIRAELENWRKAITGLPSPTGDRDVKYRDLWERYLLPACKNILDTTVISETFKDLVEQVITFVEIREVNGVGANRGELFPSEDEFSAKPAWILVGGQLLDRGQTLPNLVSTYMPRPPAGGKNDGPTGQIDTIQQRGRFYGHRWQYRKLLRGWFDSTTLETFREIARVEPLHFDALRVLDRLGLGIETLPLFLELGLNKLRLVRLSVQPENVKTIRNPTYLFRQLLYRAASGNDLTWSTFINEWSKKASWQTNRSNLTSRLPVAAIDKLLARWDASESELSRIAIVRQLLSAKAEVYPDIEVVLMNKEPSSITDLNSSGDYRTSVPVEPDSEINPSWHRITGLTSSNDAKFVSTEVPTLQVHFFQAKQPDGARIPDLMTNIGLAFSFPSGKRYVIREI